MQFATATQSANDTAGSKLKACEEIPEACASANYYFFVLRFFVAFFAFLAFLAFFAFFAMMPS